MRRFVFRGLVLGPCLLAIVPLVARAEDEPPVTTPVQEMVEVTATRLPENPIEVPASVQVVSGEEIERRQARTLSDALALVMGVSVAPGGDGGPASSVPEMMGLREFDAFLLVVDDVPWGGAFNPALPTLDLTNIDRIEVVRGSAPVLYGATSFVGVIHVIHRAPGSTPIEVRASGGSYGSFGANGFAELPPAGTWHHSISAGYDETGFKDDRTRSIAPTCSTAARPISARERFTSTSTPRSSTRTRRRRSRSRAPRSRRRFRSIRTTTRPTPSRTRITFTWRWGTTRRPGAEAGARPSP